MRALVSATFCLLLISALASCAPERMSMADSCAEYNALAAGPTYATPETNAVIYADLTDALPHMHEAMAEQLEVYVDAWGPDGDTDEVIDRTLPSGSRLAQLC